MKKVKKGIFFYIGILLGVLLAAFVVCVLIMVFSPGTSIFGLRYYNENKTKEYYNMEIYEKVETEDGPTYEYVEQKRIGEGYSVSTIKVNTNAHNVSIVKANDNDQNNTSFLAKFENKTTGFISKDFFPSEMKVNYYKDTQTLEFFAEIPVGFWTTANSSSLYIQIPESFSTENINLVVENQAGERNNGAVTIGDSKTSSNMEPNLLQFKTASIKATKGLTITDYAKIGTEGNCGEVVLDVKGGITVDSQIIATNLTIKSENGKDKYSNENGLAFSVNSITIETNSVDSTYGEIKATNIILRNTYGKQEFSKVLTTSIEVSGESKRCDYSFEEVSIGFGAGTFKVGQEANGELEEKKADKCNFTINKLNGLRRVLTTGKVEIKNQDFFPQILSVELTGEEGNRSGTLVFNDRVYQLSETVVEGEITYSIVLDEQNKIIKTIPAIVNEVIDGVKFDGFIADATWTLTISVA